MTLSLYNTLTNVDSTCNWPFQTTIIINFARASCTHTFIQVVLLGEKEKLVNCQSEQHAMHENLDLTIPVSERLVRKQL